MAQIKRSIFTTKPVAQLIAHAEGEHSMKRALGAFDLVALGIGAIVGSGIFVITGAAAAVHAGPAVVISFVIAGLVAAFAALCYSEMASMIPVSGSAYTYTYATMGELVAWIIGWDLILEYLIGASAVSVGWSGYATTFITRITGYELPAEWINAPLTWDSASGSVAWTGSYVNLPAVAITLMMTAVLILGVRESARLNLGIVFIKIAVLLTFIAVASQFVHPENWHPFVPPNQGNFGSFGPSGILQAATVVFFAYIGFDAVSTAAQECKRPQRDLPIGIIASLSVSTIFYILVALVLTGVVSYTRLDVPDPIDVGVAATGYAWLQVAVDIGAIAGLSSVMLVTLLGQPRIFLAMARDGLLPSWAAKIHPRLQTPYVTTAITGSVCAVVGGLLPIEILSELTSIGTLFAFLLVSLGVMILRRKQPDLKRPFRVPFGPYLIPLLGAGSAAFLMYTATTATLIRLFVWMAIGLTIYFAYGRRHSRLNNDDAPVEQTPGTQPHAR
ncbi:MAG: amino acid permease [Burkholderiales bacterium]